MTPIQLLLSEVHALGICTGDGHPEMDESSMTWTRMETPESLEICLNSDGSYHWVETHDEWGIMEDGEPDAKRMAMRIERFLY